jgi:hypothetical protein
VSDVLFDFKKYNIDWEVYMPNTQILANEIPATWSKLNPSDFLERSRIRAFVMTVRTGIPGRCAQRLELHCCARESAEVLLAQRIERHSLLDDNPCSG